MLGLRRIPLCLILPKLLVVATGVRGVAEEAHAQYRGNSFQCTDGTVLPAEAVNDDFCDCGDGSDEPGTGACAGKDTSLFYCTNTGGIPLMIYSSRVDDGVCDCCDGSDEAGLAAREPTLTVCKDDCEEVGAQLRQEREQRVVEYTSALEKKAEISVGASKNLLEWKEEMTTLESELPELESKLEVAREKKAAKELAEQQARKAKENEERVNSLEKEVKKKDDEIAALKGELAKCRDSLPEEPDKVLPESTGESVAPIEELAQPQPQVSDPSPPQASERVSVDVEEPQVSEYAKWMEGSGEEDFMDDVSDPTFGMHSGAPRTDAELEDINTDDEEDDGEGDGDAHDDDDYDDDHRDDWKPHNVHAVSDNEDSKKIGDVPKEEDVAKTFRDLETEVRNSKKRMEELKRDIEALPSDKFGFASLLGVELEKKIDEFKYKIEFFDNAKQDYIRLGQWKRWTGPKNCVFEGGTECWGGPKRSLNVEFECGIEAAILDVSEPSRCVYAAVVSHPGACDERGLELLQGHRVLGPRDEL